jgi:hypothetical protein
MSLAVAIRVDHHPRLRSSRPPLVRAMQSAVTSETTLRHFSTMRSARARQVVDLAAPTTAEPPPELDVTARLLDATLRRLPPVREAQLGCAASAPRRVPRRPTRSDCSGIACFVTAIFWKQELGPAQSYANARVLFRRSMNSDQS